jgi:eukaryotic-like serine/threonine-protein kinase
MMAVPKIPGYELLGCLGGGLLTRVYAARCCATDEPCAVKLLRPDWDDQPVAVKLLQREARACFAVQHPHLVRMREAQVTRAPYFLVMELLAGESLRRRLRRDYALDLRTALWVARQTAEALAALHRKGFHHGDVKPDNIRLVTAGQAVLLDLGFAHRPGENAAFLERGYILGTANYLAPELCGAEVADEPGGDVFSLGVTLFEMLTGRLPYPEGSAEATLHAHREEEPERLGDHLTAVPHAIEALLDRMLARSAEARPRADQLVQELIRHEIATLGRRRAA